MRYTPLGLPPIARWPLLPAVSGIALLICLAMVAMGWHAILTFGFSDPDDALRYVEARNFAAGQNWFDVVQHRVNPPIGGPMHWSRIVDLPISGLMLLLRPIFGSVMADRLALAIVPLLLTVALFIVLGLAVRRLADTLTAITATVLIGLSIPILIQFRPMRVDHHSWQILMAAIALWATFDTNTRRGGVVAGIAVAFWMHVSSEGLPYAALFAGVFALAFLRDARSWDRVVTYALTLAAASGVFLLGTRGWTEAAKPYCDAISPVYLFPMIAAALTLPVAHRMIGGHSWLRRAIIPTVAGIAGAAVYVSVRGACRAGPFEALDPIVYKYWYLNISEGRPVWEQTPLMAAIVIVPPLIGMIGAIVSMVRTQDADRRFAWLCMLLISFGAYAVSLMVMRALSISYLMALPGIAALMILLIPEAQALHMATTRVLATVALCGITPLGIAAIAAPFLDDGSVAEQNSATSSLPSDKPTPDCSSKVRLAGLSALPPGTIMAPLDLGPNLLAFTPHSVVATSHHRNNLGIRDVLLTFMGKPALAYKIMAMHRVRYVAYCSGSNETDNYTKRSRNGFMAQLAGGHPPTWLQPMQMRPGETIHVYRVLR